MVFDDSCVPCCVCSVGQAAIHHSYCYFREEVQACIDHCLMPSGVFDIQGGVVNLITLRRREEGAFRFRGVCRVLTLRS